MYDTEFGIAYTETYTLLRLPHVSLALADSQVHVRWQHSVLEYQASWQQVE
jgi:hypothetical protein